MNKIQIPKLIAGLILLGLGLLTLLGCQPTPYTEEASIEVTLEPTPVLSDAEVATATETTSPTETPLATSETVKTQPTESAKPTPSVPSDTTIPESAAPDSSEPLIVYERSGGYAGLTDHWEIYANGRITNSNGQEWQADPADVAQLLTEIAAAEFFTLEASYIPKNACCDLFTYSITVTDGTQTFTTTTVEQAASAPDNLWTTLDLVQAFIMDNTVN